MHDSKPLVLPKTDVSIILRVIKYLRLYDRSVLDDRGFVDWFLDEIAFALTDEAMEQAAARLSQRLQNVLVERITTIPNEVNPGERSSCGGRGQTAAELADLNARLLRVANVLSGLSQRSFSVEEIVGMPYDTKSEYLFGLDTVPGSSCRHPGCELPHVINSVFCPEHHYEMLNGPSSCSG